jgi:hypothetical protein
MIELKSNGGLAKVGGQLLGKATQCVFEFVANHKGVAETISEAQELERKVKVCAIGAVLLGLSSLGVMQAFKVRSPLLLLASNGSALIFVSQGKRASKKLGEVKELDAVRKNVKLEDAKRGIVTERFNELAPVHIGGGYGGKLIAALRNYRIDADLLGVIDAARFRRIKISLRNGVTVEDVAKLAPSLKTVLRCNQPPMVAAQRDCITVDVERDDPQFIKLDKYLSSGFMPEGTPITLPVGVDIDDKLILVEPLKSNTCHFLIGGVTGSGKSELLRAWMRWLFQWKPEEVQVVLIDPKRVTFTDFEPEFGKPSGFEPWLPYGVIKKPAAAVKAYARLLEEMQERYELFEAARVKDIAGYNKLMREQGKPILPVIFAVCDEYAELTAQAHFKKQLEESLFSLGSLARAAGISLIIATQRPSMKIVTPELRENLPCRICLMVTNPAGSRIILGGDEGDEGGIGASLLGMGDLILDRGKGFERLQSCYWDGTNKPSIPVVLPEARETQIPAAEIERGAEAVAAIASGKSAPARPAVRASSVQVTSVQVTSVQSGPVEGDVWSEEVQEEVKPAVDPGLELYREYREWRESGKAPYLFYEKHLGRCSAERKSEADRLMMPHFLTWIRELHSSGKTTEDIVLTVWNLTPTNNPGGQKFEAAMRVVEQVLAVGVKA